MHSAQAARTDEPFDAGLPSRSPRRLCLVQAVADPDETSGDVGALAQQRLPGSEPSASQGAFVMSDVMSENVAKLIAILATFSRTGHN